MTRRTLLFLFSLLASPIWAEKEDIRSVEVFTDRLHPVLHAEALPGAVIYHLDALPRALEEASAGLPNDERAASRIAAQRMSKWNRDALQASAEGLARAKLQYGLDRYPAIVINRKAVIYGVVDLSVAKRIYEEASGARP